MRLKTLHRLTELAAVLLLTSCTTPPSSLPSAEIPASTEATTQATPVSRAQASTICNHQFDARQLALGPDFIETETNSIIDGNTFGALMNSMKKASRYRGAGNTRWSINWSYGTARGATGGCSIKDPEATVAVDYHLPLWAEQVNATNRTLVSQWNNYSDALITHHCRHGKAGIDAALDVKENLQDLVVNGNCDELKENADAIARAVIGRYKQAESLFISPNIADFVQR